MYRYLAILAWAAVLVLLLPCKPPEQRTIPVESARPGHCSVRRIVKVAPQVGQTLQLKLFWRLGPKP